MSRRRDSSLRVNDLERLSVEKVGKAFQEMYVPPLGPLDDPAGVIYLDGKLADKTVDVRVLDSIGEGVQAARKELFDLGGRRRSLVEEIRAQNRRVSLGFPRNVVQEEILDKRAQETYAKSVLVESKLKRLLDHRRRLFDVLKASHPNNDGNVSLASNLIRSEPPQARVDTEGGGNNHIGARRSSLDDLKDLAKELMTREPVATERDVSTVDRSRRRSVQTPASVQEARTRQANKRALNQGWREVIEAVFSEEADRRRQVVRFREGSGEADRETKESSIRTFLVSTTPKEHIEYTVEAMNPARAQDLSSVVKCMLLHYTGPAAGELDILLGGRIGGMEVQDLLEMTLQAVDVVHVEQVPSILMLQWLLGRAPHLRSLLLRGGAVRQAFLRLERAEAKGFGAGERAMQYAALFLFMGLLFT